MWNLLENELIYFKRHHLVCLKTSIYITPTKIITITIIIIIIEKGYTEKRYMEKNNYVCVYPFISLFSFVFVPRV